MSNNHAVLKSLSSHFSCNKARIKVLSGLIMGVIRARDVNLTVLASYQCSEASHQSHYRKLQRFFEKWVMPWQEIAKLTLSKIPKPVQGYNLNIDRTNWQFGKHHINILTIGICVGKVSIPLVWKTLPQTTKRGNSNAKQRIALMNKVLKVIDSKDIYCLTMDREFNGSTWLKWLNKHEIGWVLRLRRNTLVDGQSAGLWKSTRRAKSYQCKEVFKMELYFGAKSIKKGRETHIYVVSNKFPPLEALEIYKTRWAIEVFFGHLKKKGFNFENTHMKEKNKIDKLMAVLALAFLFTIGWGVIMKEKSNLNAHQKRKSTFRLGLDMLQQMLVKPSKHKEKSSLFKQWLTHTLQPSLFVV